MRSLALLCVLSLLAPIGYSQDLIDVKLLIYKDTEDHATPRQSLYHTLNECPLVSVAMLSSTECFILR